MVQHYSWLLLKKKKRFFSVCGINIFSYKRLIKMISNEMVKQQLCNFAYLQLLEKKKEYME